jgi:hypothetical protein
MGFQLNVAAANGTLTVYDSSVPTSDASKIVDKHLLIANNSGHDQWNGENGIECSSGIYCTLVGSGSEYIIYYTAL